MSDQYKEPEIDQEDPTTEPEHEEYHQQEVWAEGSYHADPEMPEEPVPAAPAAPAEKKGCSIASFVLGLLSVLMVHSLFPSLVCSIVGFVLGLSGRKQGGKSFATAGITLSAIGFVSVVLMIVGIALLIFNSFELFESGFFEEFLEFDFDFYDDIIRIFR